MNNLMIKLKIIKDNILLKKIIFLELRIINHLFKNKFNKIIQKLLLIRSKILTIQPVKEKE